MDLGGVDIGPDHREPGEGDPMAGLYEHKRSFGAKLGGDDRRARAGDRARCATPSAGWRARSPRRGDAERCADEPSAGGAARSTASSTRLAARGHGCAGPASTAVPVADAPTGATIEVTGVTHDSRAVEPGMLFVAVPGQHADGHDFVAGGGRGWRGGGRSSSGHSPGSPRAQVVVDAARPALASAAAWWYGDPSHELTVVGITGTDGKTTTAYLAVAALEAAGRRTGMIGTIATRIGGRTDDHAVHATTPEAPELQATLRAMVDAGDEVAVIETTSHGLALDRVASVAYDVAILTNVTHEHLELHGTWEAYRDAKLSLFDRLRRAAPRPSRSRSRPTAIVNLDDPSAGVFIGTARDAGARVDHLRHGGRRGHPRDPRSPRTPTACHADDRRRRPGEATSSSGWPAGSTSTTRWPSSPWARPSAWTPGAVRTGLAGLEGVPGRMERDRGRPAVRRRSSTSPTARPRCRPCSTCSRRPPRPAAVG